MESETQQPSQIRDSSMHDRKALYKLVFLVALLLITILVSFPTGKPVYIFGYIMVIVSVLHGSIFDRRLWPGLGLKGNFLQDARQVWYYIGLDAFAFQIIPPTLGVAFAFGYFPDLLNHISGRLSVNFGSLSDVGAIIGLLMAALVLTLMEELVFRVGLQERLSWYIGTPGAILTAAMIFGLVHAIGTIGSLPIILTDVTGVALDGVFFGIIYAKTHNLLLTWATHYIADVVGLLALILLFK
jgi:membrane protease YdiL (CAAX protease family)